MGISSFGTFLKVGDGGSPTETFTTIAEVLDIGGPDLELGTQDATHHSSTAGWGELIATILRAGSISFDVQYDPVGATHDATTGLIADMTNMTLRNFQLVFPDTGTTTWTIPAYVTKFGPSAPVEGKLTASITLSPSGQPTLA
jgi:hypothetical protein